MKLWSDSFEDGGAMPARLAFGKPHPTDHVELSENRSPHLAWSDLPAGTRSLALVCHDPDVPSKPDDVNQEGREVPPGLERTDFFHWVLVDIPAEYRDKAETMRQQMVEAAAENDDGLLEKYLSGEDRISYLVNGGQQTLESYMNRPRPEGEPVIPRTHLEFFKSLRIYYETQNYIFVHAGLKNKVPLE
mgnify:CR=1 FL=1